MTTTLQELDDVMAKMEAANASIGSGQVQPAMDYYQATGDFIQTHAPEIRAALELQARVDAGVVEVIRGYHPDADHVVSIVCDCKETALRIEAALEESNAMLNAAPNLNELFGNSEQLPSAQGEQDDAS